MTDILVTPLTIDLDFTVVSPKQVLLVDTLLKAINVNEFDRCDFLINIHPMIYTMEQLIQEMSENDFERYRLFLRSIDASMCEIRDLVTRMCTFLDPTEAPYSVLQYLAPIVGIEFNFDLPEAQARQEIVNAIFLWERKGTRDNITDWIGFLTGFPARLREYYKEVLRTNVWGQAYAEDPSTITNQGGTNYATLPHLDEHHATNTWAGNAAQLPFFNFNQELDVNYGTHGFTQEESREEVYTVVAKWAEGWDDYEPLPFNSTYVASGTPALTYDGFLFRNHIGVYLDVDDSNLELTWYGEPYFYLFLQKIDRIIDLICFYGVVKHIFWRLISTERDIYCNNLEFVVNPVHTEGWNDIEDPLEATSYHTVTSCPRVGRSGIDCIGETGTLDIDNVACENPTDEGRLANVYMCTNDPNRVTNASGQQSGEELWVTWHNIRYWTLWSGRAPEVTFCIAGQCVDGDLLQTWVPTVAGGSLFTEVLVPRELSVGEQFIGPFVGTGTGQGREFVSSGISDWVTEVCETGRFDDQIITNEEWPQPFLDTEIRFDTWEVDDIFMDNTILVDDWDYVAAFVENPELVDDWDFAVTFLFQVELFDDWESTPPLTIPGAQFWFEASNGPIGNSPIHTWLDRTAEDNDAGTVIVANRPDQNANDPVFNNFGSVTFDGVDDFMFVPDAAGINSSTFTLFWVGQWNSSSVPTVNETFISKVGDELFTTGWGIGVSPDDSTGQTVRFWINDRSTNFVDAVLPFGTPTILCATYDGTQLEFRVDGAPVGTTLFGGGLSTTSTPVYLGAHYHTSAPENAAGHFNGDIAEIIYYDHVLSPTEKNFLSVYLSDKYAIALTVSDTLEVNEPWEALPLSDTQEHLETWEEQPSVPTLENSEDWEIVSPGTLTPRHLEPWEVPSPGTLTPRHAEAWEPIASLVSETWEPPAAGIDTPEATETWEPPVAGTANLIVFEPWNEVDPAPIVWFDLDWACRTTIFIENPSSLTGKSQYMVQITDGVDVDFSDFKAGGIDSRFYLADGVTAVPYEIESWDVGGVSTYWLCIDVPPFGVSAVYLYYCNPDALDAEDPSAVWTSC